MMIPQEQEFLERIQEYAIRLHVRSDFGILLESLEEPEKTIRTCQDIIEIGARQGYLQTIIEKVWIARLLQTVAQAKHLDVLHEVRPLPELRDLPYFVDGVLVMLAFWLITEHQKIQTARTARIK
jgi:hypothetical protein